MSLVPSLLQAIVSLDGRQEPHGQEPRGCTRHGSGPIGGGRKPARMKPTGAFYDSIPLRATFFFALRRYDGAFLFVHAGLLIYLKRYPPIARFGLRWHSHSGATAHSASKEDCRYRL